MASFEVPANFQNACPGHVDGPAGLMFTQMIQVLMTAQCAFNSAENYPEDYGDRLKDGEEFDFVVVGAGSSGSVIASRLSENPEWKVLLVEAGGDPSFVSDVPGFLFSTHDTHIDWKYRSEKNVATCLGMIDERCPYPRGKVLGGSSSINAMLYVRGNSEDYDEWQSLGNPEWDYENVLKYFKRSENLNGYHVSSEREYSERKESGGWVVSEKYHGTEGPLSVSPFANGALDHVKNPVLEGFEELGVPSMIDFNGEKQIGVSNAPGTLYRGTRANTAKMFLSPVKDRENLFVVKQATVTKVIIQNLRAKGIELIRNNETKTVAAVKEVIISAGAINSPQLLLLSGIGSREKLEKFGIRSILDLKGVGENLQDHLMFVGSPFWILKENSQPLSPIVALDAMYMFLTNRPGTFSSIGLTDLTGFVDTKNNGSVPDIQFMFIYFSQRDSYLLPEVVRKFKFDDNIRGQYFDMVKDSGVLVIAPTLLRPANRGRVELRSGSHSDPPKIFADFLRNEENRETILRGIRFVEKLSRTKGFQALSPEAIRFGVRECDSFEFKSDDYWLCLIKYLSTSLYHPVGTCKMGPESDEFAVVDARLRVHGLKNLRVADASIMPKIVRGNTNAPAIMIGEKCADFIKEDWSRRSHTEL